MKNIIPIILVGTSLLGGGNIAYAASKADANVWADSDSKDWGNTPESVKYVLSNVQISRSQGNNGNSKQTDLFSTKWLKEMQRSPSTYRLTESDKKWVDNVLANAEAKNSNTWKPSNKTPVAPKPKIETPKMTVQATTPAVPKPVEIAKKEIESKPLKSKDSPIIPTGTGLTKDEMQKQVNKMAKAESKPLPSPKIEVKEKPDLTPVKSVEAEIVKEKPIIDENKEVNIQEEKPTVSEMDAFIATLPVIASEDLPISEIDQTKEEMSDFREMYSEQSIQKALNDNAFKKSFEDSLDRSLNVSVNQALKNSEYSFDIKEFESIPENQSSTFEIKPFETSLKDDSKAVQENLMVIKNDIEKESNSGWIMSALSSLILIAIFMFGIVLYTGKKLKDSGKLDKYI